MRFEDLNGGARMSEAPAHLREQGLRFFVPLARLRDYFASSSRPAAPMPPPMHMLTTAYLPPRRFSS